MARDDTLFALGFFGVLAMMLWKLYTESKAVAKDIRAISERGR